MFISAKRITDVTLHEDGDRVLIGFEGVRNGRTEIVVPIEGLSGVPYFFQAPARNNAQFA